ncbi:hypothetical protein Pan216_09380 [Planctomycetes bacterium Pan216]|uniref:Uncharacterized protein n=1 Tax=Kolteria novifilia TaxID=2527975 RepID=A0A518AZG4_9BACT|nr:hypothetical protein Pan216_09380 [Planctomycetes bacterium Pan216]
MRILLITGIIVVLLAFVGILTFQNDDDTIGVQFDKNKAAEATQEAVEGAKKIGHSVKEGVEEGVEEARETAHEVDPHEDDIVE